MTSKNCFARESVITDYRAENRNPVPLLYQSGYLTIKGYDKRRDAYRLGIPNERSTLRPSGKPASIPASESAFFASLMMARRFLPSTPDPKPGFDTRSASPRHSASRTSRRCSYYVSHIKKRVKFHPVFIRQITPRAGKQNGFSSLQCSYMSF